MTISPVIELHNVSKHYDSTPAVDQITLSVNEGDILVLLGSSGCGKTTTLRLIAGLERPNGGSVRLDGRTVAGDGAWVQPENRKIGMVFQDYALFPHLSVNQNIDFALAALPRRQRPARVHEMLDLVGLAGMGDRFPHQLSGGQQQRVALARALAPAPSVVLLDEPFSNLDAALRKTMRDEVRRILNEADATAVFVTHDQEEAMSLADEIAVLRGGQLLQVGEPDELYRHPATPEVAAFLGEMNLIPATANGKFAQTTLGSIELARPVSGDVEVMVRPESLRLTPASDGPATVGSVQFFGYYQLLTLDIADIAEPLTARVWAQEQFSVGDRLHVAVQGTAVAFDSVQMIEA